MKVAIFLISNGFSGAERVAYNLINSLRKLNIEVQLILNNEILKYYLTLKDKRIKINNLGNCLGNNLLYNRIKIIKPKNKLKEILKREKFDIISTHMIISPEFYKIVFSNKIPHILTFHGSEIKSFIESKRILYKILFKPILSSVFLKSNLLISVSHHQIQNLPEKYKKKTVVIPNGVDSKIFKPIKSIKQKKNIILFIGKFVELKGIREILSVAKQLPQYEFWFVGQGPLAKEIKGTNINNLGFKSTEGLVKLYNRATICIAPSHRESFGLVGLEAMSCSRSVIATPLGFSEYIKNGKDGIIIPARDEKALKDAIIDLMKNPAKRKRIEKNARKKALKYSWDKIAKQYLKVFKEVIKENKKQNEQ